MDQRTIIKHIGNISITVLKPLIELIEIEHIEQYAKNNKKLEKLIKKTKDPEARVNFDEANYIIEILKSITSDQGICVQPPSKFNIKGDCRLRHLFFCSNTLREALYYMEKFAPLLCDNLDINVTKTRDGIIKVKLPVNDFSMTSAGLHQVEIILSTLIDWISQLCGDQFSLYGINLPFEKPSYYEAYETCWKSTINYQTNECCLMMHMRWLDEGLHKTSPHILSMMKNEVQEQYRKLARSGSLAERIRKALLQDKLRLNSNQQQVASYFHISARTLNRYLQRENTSLKQVVTGVRLETAKRLLVSTNEPIEHIAMQVGLSGRRTLDRIFINSINHSPAQFRQAHKLESMYL